MIAREGLIFILSGGLLTLITIWIANKLDNGWVFGLSLTLGVLTLFTTYFFRDPERVIPEQPNAIVAPADGRVVVIDTLDSPDFVGESTIQVSIFLSVFDVHVNRVPQSGRIEYVDYNEGKFLAAYNDKASMENEQTEIGMTTISGHKLAFKQIAGLVARRIVCKLNQGDSVGAGDRFGLIRFGSRADLLLPVGSTVDVKVGDQVKGGASIIGRLPESKIEFAEGSGDA